MAGRGVAGSGRAGQSSSRGMAGSDSNPSSTVPATILTVVLLLLVLVGGSVVALCKRAKTTRRNKEERRRLARRVGWLRDLLQLLPPASSSSTAPEKENGSGTAATAVRTVLARRLEATVGEADRLLAAGSCATRCCLWRFFRCYAQARRLERAGAGVDEAYAQLLPVVSQIDATQCVVHMLAALHQRTSSSQHRRDDGAQHPFGHNHSDTQPAAARPNGNEDLDWQPNHQHVDAQAATGDPNEYRSGEGTARMTGP